MLRKSNLALCGIIAAASFSIQDAKAQSAEPQPARASDTIIVTAQKRDFSGASLRADWDVSDGGLAPYASTRTFGATLGVNL